MIYNPEMFAGKCDRCNAEVMENTEYSCFGEREMIIDEMMEAGWFADGEKHYCPDCYFVNDNDQNEILPPIKTQKD